MRILIHDYAGHSFPISLSRELAKRGFEVVHAFASQLQTPRGELARRLGDPERLSFVSVPMDEQYVERKYSFRHRWLYERRYGHSAADVIRRFRPEVVLSGNTPTEPQGEILRAAREVNARFVYWVQDFYSLAVSRLLRKHFPVFGAAVGAWYRVLDRWQLRRSAAIVTITEDFRPRLELWQIPHDSITSIPNWADLSCFPQRPKINAWSREHGLDNKFVFLYSGTLGMKHNPDLLLRLAERFDKDPSVVLLVNSEGLGAAYLAREKERLGLKGLRLNGFQAPELMAEVLASSDVCITLLEADAGEYSVPSKVLAYLCAGRAQLAAVPSQNLVARTIEGIQAGFVTRPEDRDGFVAAAETLRRDEALSIRCGRNARAFAEREFDIARIADRFEDVFGLRPSGSRTQDQDKVGSGSSGAQ